MCHDRDTSENSIGNLKLSFQFTPAVKMRKFTNLFRDIPTTLSSLSYCRCYFLPIFVCPRKGRGKNQEAPRAWDFRRYKNVPRNLCGINDVFTSMFSRAACRWKHRYVDTTELPTQQPRITNTGYANYPHRPAIIPITNQ